MDLIHERLHRVLMRYDIRNEYHATNLCYYYSSSSIVVVVKKYTIYVVKTKIQKKFKN